jgi:streptogramin lyase
VRPRLLIVLVALAGCGGGEGGEAARPCEPVGDRVAIPDGTGRVAVGGFANLVAVGEGSLWVLVAESRDRQVVLRIDPRDGRVRRHRYDGSEEARLAAGAGALWLTDPQSGAVTRIDAATGRATDVRPFGTTAARELSVAGDAVWVSPDAGGRLARLDPATGRVEQRIRLPGVNEVADLDVGAAAIWVTTGEDGRVVRIRDGRPVGATRTGAETLDVEAAGDHAWVDLGDADTLVRVAPDGGIVRRVGNGRNAFAIAVGYGSVWVTNYGLGTVTRLDERTGERIGRPVGAGRDVKGAAAGEGAIWVANADECTVSRIEP